MAVSVRFCIVSAAEKPRRSKFSAAIRKNSAEILKCFQTQETCLSAAAAHVRFPYPFPCSKSTSSSRLWHHATARQVRRPFSIISADTSLHSGLRWKETFYYNVGDVYRTIRRQISERFFIVASARTWNIACQDGFSLCSLKEACCVLQASARNHLSWKSHISLCRHFLQCLLVKHVRPHTNPSPWRR